MFTTKIIIKWSKCRERRIWIIQLVWCWQSECCRKITCKFHVNYAPVQSCADEWNLRACSCESRASQIFITPTSAILIVTMNNYEECARIDRVYTAIVPWIAWLHKCGFQLMGLSGSYLESFEDSYDDKLRNFGDNSRRVGIEFRVQILTHLDE